MLSIYIYGEYLWGAAPHGLDKLALGDSTKGKLFGGSIGLPTGCRLARLVSSALVLARSRRRSSQACPCSDIRIGAGPGGRVAFALRHEYVGEVEVECGGGEAV